MGKTNGGDERSRLHWAMGPMIGAVVMAAAIYQFRIRTAEPAPSASEAENSQAEALARQMRKALEDGLREREAGPTAQPLPDGGGNRVVSEEELSGILERVAKGHISGQPLKNDPIGDAELAALPLAPFPGSSLKHFRWIPRRPGAYTMWVEGAGDIEQITAFYLAAVRREDPEATPVRDGHWVKIRSKKASADVDIYEDGKTVGAQVTLWRPSGSRMDETR